MGFRFCPRLPIGGWPKRPLSGGYRYLLLRGLAVALIGVGLFPLTPLIWLLVLVQGPAPWPFDHVRLAFWQTQGLGAVLALAGLALILTTMRREK